MLSLYFFFLFFQMSPVDNTSLDVSLIPETLLENAHAIVRYEHTKSNIVSLDRMYITKEKAITILSEKGASAGIVSIYYTDEVEKVKDLEIVIYDAKGEKIKKVKKKEIRDLSVFDGFSIKQDARRKYFSFTPNSYPYTISYEYVKESKNTLYIPFWYPVGQSGVSVEENTYNIDCSIPDYKLMFKAKNLDHPSIQMNEELYEFEAKNFKAIRNEPRSPHSEMFIPSVSFVPRKFKYFGSEGSFSNWKEYGKWVYDNMLKDQDEIPEKVFLELDALIPEGSSKEDIARIVYDYVTESTRYVSIQLGIGGLKPFSPEEVYNLKYGDCKALSFYTAKILERYGIEAIYTEIQSEREYAVDYEEDLPGPFQGNHIILCLPNDGDTTWLECTTGAFFYGYAHTGIDDRKALLITPEGGRLIKTKKYSAEENLAQRKVDLSIVDGSMVEARMNNTFHNQRHERRTSLLDESKTTQESLLRSYFYDHLPQYELKDYTIEVNNDKKFIAESAKMQIDKLTEKAGYYIILPYMVSKIDLPSKLSPRRVNDIYLKMSKKDEITINVEIPEGYQIVDKDEDLNFANEFGSIAVRKVKKDEKTIEVVVEIVRNSGSFAPEKVKAYNKFAESIDAIKTDKIIFKPR